MSAFPSPVGGASLILSFRPAQKTVLVVGTGPLAASRAFAALEADAKVVVLGRTEANDVCEELKWRSQQHQLELFDLSGPSGDGQDRDAETLEDYMTRISDVSLVCVTDTSLTPGFHHRRSVESATRIALVCRRWKIPLNVADQPDLCDFTFTSTHRFTDSQTGLPTALQVGVTSNGQGCRLAGRLRRDLVSTLPKDVGDAVVRVGKLRILAKGSSGLEGSVTVAEADSDLTPNTPVPQGHQSETTVDMARRRMRWVAQVSEYWPIPRLATLSHEEMTSILGGDAGTSSNVQVNGTTSHPKDSKVPSVHALPLNPASPKGRIYLTGSGPGHPSLLTIATHDALTRRANLVLSDKLVPAAVLALIPAGVEVKIARKFPGNADGAQNELMEVAIEAANRGLTVVRLKQGDPSVYGRAGEEVLYFRAHGYEPIVIPGVSSVIAGPTFAGIPVTQRGAADSLMVCTGVGRQGKEVKLPGYERSRSLVILMGVARLPQVLDALMSDDTPLSRRNGPAYPAHTPIALIERASMPDQRVVATTLESITAAMESIGEQRPPGMLVIGWSILSLWGEGDMTVLDEDGEKRDDERIKTWLGLREYDNGAMPPRRSTRSASVQPAAPVEVKPPSKRKRGQTSEVVEVVIEQENLKPASRTRKAASSAPASKRASSSRKKSLEEVQEEEDEDEQEASPPVKKARPSVGSGEEDYEEEVSKAKAVRDRKAPVKKEPAARVSSRARAPQKVDSDEVEEAKPTKPAVRARTSRASSTSKAKAPTPSSRRSGRSIRSLRTKQKEEPEHEDPDPNEIIEDSEDDLLGSQCPPSKRVSVKVEIPEPSVPATQGRSHRQPPAQPATSRSRKTPAKGEPATEEGVEDEDEDEAQPDSEAELLPSHTPPRQATPPRQEDAEEEEEDAENVDEMVREDAMEDDSPAAEEEEMSLLDSVPRPSQAQAPAEEESQGPKPRLVIHKMSLINFKSYAGRQDIGPFHKSFSAIVGPNGSGKSNTIDALLFVFGYRASKMRQGKLSELIHNSARHPDLEECSVEIHFRDIVDLPGPDAFEIVPDSGLIVTRTAYKNNSSRYTINGRQSTYKEGEVESIAQMKPKAPSEHEDGLLEYLEDIIGTSRFKEPIEEALAEMDRLNEDRAEKMNRLKIVERERNALEEEKKEAEEYLRTQNEFVKATSRLYQWYIWKLLLSEEQFTQNIALLEQELKDETERNKDDITHLELLETHFKTRSATYEEVKRLAAAAIKDLQEQEKRQVGLEERRKHSRTKEKKLKKSLQDEEHARNDALRAIEDNTTKMEKEKAKADELEESLSNEESVLEEIRDSLKDKTQVFHDKIEEKQKELQPWTAKINSKKTEIDIATSERDDLVKKAESVKASLEEARGALEQLEADQKAKASEMNELEATRSQSQRDAANGDKKLQNVRARVQELRSKASSFRQKADDAKASQQANTSQNKVLDSLSRLKSSGRISGFHGRLGSLGTIPDKYDVAISTACSALNNLVVDTVEQGQGCIEYLRKQNVGRASFMVLEKLSSHGLARIQTPENVPRLFDLIKPKEDRFAPAFYKGVRDTLVADDLEQANRIAYNSTKRWRVVTLAGQLIDASDSVSPDVLRQHEHDSERAALELEQAQQELRELEGQLEHLTRSVPQLDTSIEKLFLDIRNGEKRITEAQKRVQQLKAQCKPDAGDVARITVLEEDIATATETLDDLQEKTAAIEQDIKALEKKILEIGGSRLLAQKSKVDGIRLHINLANDEITKAEVAKAKAEKDSVKLQNSLETNQASLADAQHDIEELEAQLTQCNEYVDEVRSKVDAAKAAEENSKDDLDNLKAELDQKTEEIQAFRQKEMSLKQQLSDAQKELVENGKNLDQWQIKHDKLKLEDIDDDDDDEEEAEPEAEAGSSNSVKPEPGEGGIPKSKAKPKRNNSTELHQYSADELAQFKRRELVADVELLDDKLKNKPNLGVLKDYRKREEEFLRRASDLENVTKSRDEQKMKYENLTKQRLDEFMTGFSTISLKLKEMYQMITLGGNAELELVDSMDPFSEGIIFSVMPPKKSWRNISNLSGGEKTLSSLALVFALHVYKPTPLYFMDEIDAALDFRNVSIVANYIKDRTKNAQFIIISLRNDMFELSHRLIGIYKTSNATRSISIDNHALHAAPLDGHTFLFVRHISCYQSYFRITVSPLTFRPVDMCHHIRKHVL
ncbi:hypothetical protein EUX98_g1311 [Antrodiella citrinella]|uniref:Structural maintenance of chromosomes protein 4 n=1 Tax=Antrodiella citrinella TaxID=2447956 RepID=A0A4S4N1M5_9APHY|nr:hypothetical protein EUX98_g1311 [Antrodiella citrinella]